MRRYVEQGRDWVDFTEAVYKFSLVSNAKLFITDDCIGEGRGGGGIGGRGEVRRAKYELHSCSLGDDHIHIGRVLALSKLSRGDLDLTETLGPGVETK